MSSGIALLATACAPSQLDLSKALSQEATAQTQDSQSKPDNDASPQAASSVPNTPQIQTQPNLGPDLVPFQQNSFVEDGNTYYIGQLLPPDGILPIYEPTFILGSRATYNPDELVIGVAIDGEAKAYPITLLRSREMVNDEIAGTPILVTW